MQLGFALLFAIIAVFYFDEIIIIGTSLVGAFLMAHGVSNYVGGFPNPFTIITEKDWGVFTEMDPVFFAYLGAILLLTIIGSFI